MYEIINGVNTKCNNASISETYKGWIDLFGWGTWGEGKNPCLCDNNAEYSWSSDFAGDLADGNKWRVLRYEEWEQLRLYANSNNKIGKGKITDVNLNPSGKYNPQGIIIIPINADVDGFIPYNSQISTYNDITSTEWNNNYKTQGALFLPWSPGYRIGTTVYNVNSRAYYWTSTLNYGDANHNPYFASPNSGSGLSVTSTYSIYKYYGCPLRLAY